MAENQRPILPFEAGHITPNTSRAADVRRDTDLVKLPKVTLYDIDYAVLWHINKNMALKIEHENRMIDVPAIFADGERWAQIKSRGYMRDASKKLMAPIIAIRRTSVDEDDRLHTLDLNNKTARVNFYPYKTLENKYDRFGGQLNRKPSNEYYAVQMPDYVRVNYDLIIWTHQIEQLNSIVQAFVSISNHMWGDYYTFRASITGANMNTTNTSGEDRIVSATIPLIIDGYLMQEYEYKEANVDKAFTVKTVRFTAERDESDFYINEPYFGNSQYSDISQEDQAILNRNLKRNIRFR